MASDLKTGNCINVHRSVNSKKLVKRDDQLNIAQDDQIVGANMNIYMIITKFIDISSVTKCNSVHTTYLNLPY